MQIFTIKFCWTGHIYKQPWPLQFHSAFSDLNPAGGFRDQKKAQPDRFISSHSFQLIRMWCNWGSSIIEADHPDAIVDKREIIADLLSA